MGRAPKAVEEATDTVEDALALVNRIDHNQRRIALRTDDNGILNEVEDTRTAAAGLKRRLLAIYPGNEKRADP